MNIELKAIGKKFNRDWVFKGVDLNISAGERFAILGPNGSGKSTLLQLISGILSPNAGQIIYSISNTQIEVEEVYQHLSIAAPYLELPEEMTLIEVVDFHFSFKGKFGFKTKEEFVSLTGLEKAVNKEIRYFSSGMKQRVKLALAIYSDVSCILLDEPTTNLDEQGLKWYLKLMNSAIANRTVLVSSNQPAEYAFCNKEILIANYKS